MKFDFSTLPELTQVIESPLEAKGINIGWHVVVKGHDGLIGGGINVNKNLATRVAMAEVIERKYFRHIAKSELAKQFMLDQYPTTCGFAAGFHNDSTRLRAIAEGVERWAWSKWIDQGHSVPEVSIDLKSLSPIAEYLFKEFDETRFYCLSINTSYIPNFPNEVFFGVVIGDNGEGVFPGSRVALTQAELWEHALVEAYRHLIIFRAQKDSMEPSFPTNRIINFGRNKKLALGQIQKANKLIWPSPSLLLEQQYLYSPENIYIWRSLMNDFIGWEKSDENRFVY